MIRYDNLRVKAVRAGLKVRAPASPRDIADFEMKSGVRLPEDYAFFLTHVANGGIAPCRLVALEDWDTGFWSSVSLESALRKPCVIAPDAEARGESWLTDLRVADWEEKWDSDEWDPLYGTIAVAEIGCGLFYHLIVNGEFYGRIFSWGDHALSPPVFVAEVSFSDWIERHLDAIIAGEPVHFLDGRIQ
jgi:hypothetical protein